MALAEPLPPAPDLSLAVPPHDPLLASQRIDRILDTVRAHLGMEIAFIGRYRDDETRELTHISTELPIPHRPGFREPKQESYCFHILEGRLPELIPDAAALAFARTLPITKALPVGCHLNIPLRLADGSVYGSFCALSRAANDTITERDMQMMRAFAKLAVGQIEDDLRDSVERERIERAVAAVVAERGLTIAHQPIHDLRTGEPAGVECLARFPDAAERGPDRWFDDAASVGMGLKLELHAIETALATAPYVPPGKYLSVNASPECVISGRIAPLLGGLPRERLVIEVTEHQAVEDFPALTAALAGLRPHARIAIDDVGAGYAGLRHIVDLAPDILKLDMSLTRDIHRDPARRALAVALVGFAEEIETTLVAEGIENGGECAVLRELGVAYGQGWHFARPMPVVRAQQHLLGVAAADPVDRPIGARPLRAAVGY